MIYVFGYPGPYGGANSELGHVVALWRKYGVDVTLIPSWKETKQYRQRLDAIGCHTLTMTARDLALPDDSIVVSFCNTVFVKMAHRLRKCRLVWVPCMTYLLDVEKTYYKNYGPFAATVFHSQYQRDMLLPQLRQYDVTPEQCHLIRGALDIDEFPYHPRARQSDDPLVIGRLSRSDPKKFSPDTWSICDAVPNTRIRLMGWDTTVRGKIGNPPENAEIMAKGTESSVEFLQSLHLMLQANDDAIENWPRTGLEAMATGVPVVVDNRGGWPEMVQHGRTGMLCGDAGEFRQAIRQLAENEPLRLEIAARAREAVEEELACPEMIWANWKTLFEELRQ